MNPYSFLFVDKIVQAFETHIKQRSSGKLPSLDSAFGGACTGHRIQRGEIRDQWHQIPGFRGAASGLLLSKRTLLIIYSLSKTDIIISAKNPY